MRCICLLVTFLFAATFLNGQPVTSAKTGSIQNFEEDFDVLQKALEEVHGGIYRFLTKQQVQSHFLGQRAKLKSAKTKNDFIAIISETLAGLRDGHLRLEYDAATTSELSSSKLFPLSLALEDGNAVVLFNESTGNTTLTPGTTIVAVNGVAMKDLIGKIMPKVSGDGFIETGKLWRIERSFHSYYWLFIDQTSSFEVEVRTTGGQNQKIRLDGVNAADRASNRASNPANAAILKNLPPANRPNINLTFPRKDVACVSIQGFQGSDFKSELDSVFHTIAGKKSTSVILDLRGNGGGVDEYGAYLVSQFTDKPFRYFDHIHLRSTNPSFTKWKSDTYDDLNTGTRTDPSGGYLVTAALHPGVGIQQPGKYPFGGKVVVLLNGGTFSTAADVTATLHNMGRATFIGEESGGGYQGNTSGLNARVVLPHSGLSVRISLYDYWNAVTPKFQGRGTIPDLNVENKVADLVQSKDVQFKRALEIAANK